MACNASDPIRPMLESLLRQDLFERLWSRHEQCEIVVVAHGCTDQTAAVAHEVFDQLVRTHEWAEAITVRVVELPENGRSNAWNRFVHEFSSLEARFLCVMEPDITFHQRNTVSTLLTALERRAYANVVSGHACPDALFKPRPTLKDRLVLAKAKLLAATRGQISSQLYCLRAHVARRIFLPRSLGTAEPLIRELICTELLTRAPDPARVSTVVQVSHLAATDATRSTPFAQQREIMALATTHTLLDYLRTRPRSERRDLMETLRQLETCDSEWLQKLVRQRIRSRRFWALFPGSLTFRLRRLWHRTNLRSWALLPASMGDFPVTLQAAWTAHDLLREGVIADVPAASRPVPVHQLGAKSS
jgi:hypothetical protein